MRLKKRHLFAALVAGLLIADFAAARLGSRIFTATALRWARTHSAARVEFDKAEFHPLFLSFSVKNIRVFEASAPEAAAFRADKLRGRASLIGFLTGRPALADLVVEGFELNAVKDDRGTLNVEKLFKLKDGADSAGSRFVGWKHRDWIFNGYERLKYEAAAKEPSPPPRETFRVASVVLRNGALTLSDRTMEPLRFDAIRMTLHGLAWHADGSASFRSLAVAGELRAAEKGEFQLKLERRRGRIDVGLKLRGVDLKRLTPLYKDTSPVYFKTGVASMDSRTRLEAGRLLSKNRLSVRGHEMSSVVDWSPQSQIFLGVLNKHPELTVDFKIVGDPNEPDFVGIEDSFMRTIARDFDAKTLKTIRHRIGLEIRKLETRFSRPSDPPRVEPAAVPPVSPVPNPA